MASGLAWVSRARFAEIADDYEAHLAPDVCVEVLSRTNTEEEINAKKSLYIGCGAMEVWVCDLQGRLRFFTEHGEREMSLLFPTMLKAIAVFER